jgi:aconitate hydratase
MNVAQKLISMHLISGEMTPGTEIGLRVDQTLCQDATGTMVMLECEALNLKKIHTSLSVQYVDHNLLQTDFKNPDDHIFLLSACKKFGLWFSSPGNGVSHIVHMERFGKPGTLLLGADSHTCAGGSMGMLAIGVGGLEVAMALAGQPFHCTMPKILGVKLTGHLQDWVSAKDVILELLRRYRVKGGLGRIVEYYGPGLATLSAMDRHVIANMGAEIGATTSVFPSDSITLSFLKSQQRQQDWLEICADEGAQYDEYDEIDLTQLEPLIALPSSPDQVVPVREVAGRPIYQAMIGSSANPGLRDFAISAEIVSGEEIATGISFDINPTSRQVLENLIHLGFLEKLIASGARLHQAGCNGCIGMGQAPATGRISLRTVPRNFPGRSGTQDDQVYLCSPETAAASALTGVITDPRTLNKPYPRWHEPQSLIINTVLLIKPSSNTQDVTLIKGPNIVSLPLFDPIPKRVAAPVLIKVGDHISTDTILPAGAKVLPFRSNIPGISRFVFSQIDEDYAQRALQHKQSGSWIVGGENYGQGSSREHAALAPRYLGVFCVLAKSFARIHRQNLINFGILPILFTNPKDYDAIVRDDVLCLEDLDFSINPLTISNQTQKTHFLVQHDLVPREQRALLAGGLINLWRKRS